MQLPAQSSVAVRVGDVVCFGTGLDRETSPGYGIGSWTRVAVGSDVGVVGACCGVTGDYAESCWEGDGVADVVAASEVVRYSTALMYVDEAAVRVLVVKEGSPVRRFVVLDFASGALGVDQTIERGVDTPI